MLKHPNYDKQEVKRKFTSGVPVFREELDDSLFEFLQSEQDAVPANILGGEALRIADNLSLCNFKASSWLDLASTHK